jgi:preprotein translocase subunit SecA
MGEDHIEHKMLSKGIENAQRRIESRNFDARKSLLEYDDVSNDQRQAIYSLRNQLLEESDISETIAGLIEEKFQDVSNTYIPFESIESQWKAEDLEEHLKETYQINLLIAEEIINDKKLLPNTIALKVIESAEQEYKKKYELLGKNRLLLEKQVMLQVLDVHWKEHLAEIDHLRNSVGLRAYAQKNPKNEFKREAYSMFESMLEEIDSETIRILFSLQISSDQDMGSLKTDNDEAELVMNKEDIPSGKNTENKQSNNQPSQPQTIVRETPKLGRNEICLCGSGKKFKHCHGK